jgi:Protein of unknown function (DUF2855)
MAYDLLVNKSNIREAKITQNDPLAGRTLAANEVLLKIDHFALTANNITYAAFGETMKYWDFFPAETGWGRVPVWGFATVMSSRVEGIAVGERFYGYYPMSSFLLVQPTRVGKSSFSEGSAHRSALHPLYNQYLRTSTDPSYRADTEAQQMLLRPLFITSFVIEDFFDDNQHFGAQQIIISSASSKTSYGTGFAFHHRKKTSGTGPKVVGLTSSSNRAFVESLGCYDQVISYEELNTLPKIPSAYIDMAGGLALRAAVHSHFGDLLKHSCVIGNTQWDKPRPAAGEKTDRLPGAKPTFFFAPEQIKKRMTDWGAAGFGERFAKSWQALLEQVMHPTKPWMTVQISSGPEAVAETYAEVVEGVMDPRVGHILKP